MPTNLIDLITFSEGLSYPRMIFALMFSFAAAIYIFFAYRVLTRSAFYSKSFNLTMAGMAVVTTAIIIAMQSSLIISLGMVGALSIVRFRTAVKDPMDLLFLFWSIGVGIICGTELYLLAIILSAAVTVLLLVLDHVPVKKPPFLLVVNSTDTSIEPQVVEIVNRYAKKPAIKSRNINKRGLDMILELRTDKPAELVRDITEALSVELSLIHI